MRPFVAPWLQLGLVECSILTDLRLIQIKKLQQKTMHWIYVFYVFALFLYILKFNQYTIPDPIF